MIYAFAFPLALGAFPLLSIAVSKKRVPSVFALKAWKCGIAVLSVGSIVKGVLDIYGTTNRLIIVYPVMGIILLSFGIITYLKK